MKTYPTEWKLADDYYKDIYDPKIVEDFQKGTDLVHEFVERYKGQISNLRPEEFLEFFELESQLNHNLSKVLLYFFYSSSLESQNQEILKKESEYETRMVELSNQMMFVSEEFKQIGYQGLLELSRNPVLSEYSNFFLRKAKEVQYLLGEETEKVINLKDSAGVGILNKLYEELTGSFQYKIKINGQEKTLTEEEVRSLRMSNDEGIRKTATLSLLEMYGNKNNQITIGNIYKGVVKNWVTESKLRGFQTVLQRRNLSEEMPDETVDLLFKTVSDNYKLYQRYLKTKLKLIKKNHQQNNLKERLDIWNIFAPVTQTAKSYDFNKALELFLKTLKSFDPEMEAMAENLFLNSQVDVFPKPGKRGGAYACYEKNFESRVLLNFTGTLSDVTTIAHEIGHAIHGMLSQKQPGAVFSTSLCLAETASVFNEMIFFQALLKDLHTREEKLELLNSRLQDIFSTIFVQIMYACFERECHQSFFEGKDLGYTDFNHIWRKNQESLFGEIVDFHSNKDKAVSWSGIGHFFRTPFYVYSYAFGSLLTFSLYEIYLEQGRDFVERYKAILSAGGGTTPYKLLLSNGIDITSESFFEKGIKVIENLLSDFEQLAGL